MPTFEIALATDDERELCARTMAATDPWLRLGRGIDVCRAASFHPEYDVWVAREGGVPLGFMRLHPRGVAGSPYVASIAVVPAAQGRGVGTAILDHVEAHYGSRYIFLCVSSFNPRARALYERRGYRLLSVLEDYVLDGLDEHLMAKRLIP